MYRRRQVPSESQYSKAFDASHWSLTGPSSSVFNQCSKAFLKSAGGKERVEGKRIA